MSSHLPKSEAYQRLEEAAAKRILVLDGGMGTSIQSYRLSEEDYRGDKFDEWPCDLKGNNDLLNVTRPDTIREIHETFLEVGSDIIETNTFNGTTISQADYDCEDWVDAINKQGARLARQAADSYSQKTPDKPRFVAGALGPTNKTLSVSPDVNRPAFREVTFDRVKAAYLQQAKVLMDNGCDILMVETVFDTLNAKAALFAIDEVAEERGERIPIIISGTITDLSGRNLSGQTVEAFWHSLRHSSPFAIGLNCAFGADQLRPHVAVLSKKADAFLCVYPNAGLPNDLGEYDETPNVTAGHLGSWAQEGLLNLVGGCCGTTPAHLKAIAEAVDGVAPRQRPETKPAMRLSGLEAVTL